MFKINVKRIVRTSFILGCLILFMVGAINLIVMGTAKAYFLDPALSSSPDLASEKAECLIVFGALVKTDGKVSLILKDRLDEALDYWRQNKQMKVIVSGDHGRKNYDEVRAMRLYLENAGVPTEQIYMDHAGFNTYETLYRARDVFKVKSAVLVTQKYHLYRAVYIGKNLGLSVNGLPSDRRQYYLIVKYQMREMLARTKDFLNVHVFRPKPTYLGEPIPIQEKDGFATHD